MLIVKKDFFRKHNFLGLKMPKTRVFCAVMCANNGNLIFSKKIFFGPVFFHFGSFCKCNQLFSLSLYHSYQYQVGPYMYHEGNNKNRWRENDFCLIVHNHWKQTVP